jgi:hypothetical protein
VSVPVPNQRPEPEAANKQPTRSFERIHNSRYQTSCPLYPQKPVDILVDILDVRPTHGQRALRRSHQGIEIRDVKEQPGGGSDPTRAVEIDIGLALARRSAIR